MELFPSGTCGTFYSFTAFQVQQNDRVVLSEYLKRMISKTWFVYSKVILYYMQPRSLKEDHLSRSCKTTEKDGNLEKANNFCQIIQENEAKHEIEFQTCKCKICLALHNRRHKQVPQTYLNGTSLVLQQSIQTEEQISCIQR